MEVSNDNSCSWINDLSKRSNIKIINKNQTCEWLVVGAGYTGLSAARKLDASARATITDSIFLIILCSFCGLLKTKQR